MAALKLLRRRLEPGDDWFRRRLPGRELAWHEATVGDVRWRWSLRSDGRCFRQPAESALLDGTWRGLSGHATLVAAEAITPGQRKQIDEVPQAAHALLLEIVRKQRLRMAQGYRV